MGRKNDLQDNIRKSYQLVQKYNAIVRTSDRPEEVERANAVIDDQWSLICGYAKEYVELQIKLRFSIPKDIKEIITACDDLPPARKPLQNANSPATVAIDDDPTEDLPPSITRKILAILVVTVFLFSGAITLYGIIAQQSEYTAFGFVAFTTLGVIMALFNDVREFIFSNIITSRENR